MQINAAKDSANISFQSILLCASLNLTRMSARRLIFAFSPCSELPGSNRLEAGTPRAAPICLAAGHSNDKCRTSDATSLPQSPQPRVVTLSRSPLCHPPTAKVPVSKAKNHTLQMRPIRGVQKISFVMAMLRCNRRGGSQPILLHARCFQTFSCRRMAGITTWLFHLRI